jgi:hypothetical protein
LSLVYSWLNHTKGYAIGIYWYQGHT